MKLPIKVIITSKKNLQVKYGTAFTEVHKLLTGLVANDKTRNIRTMIVYIDDAASTAAAGIKPVATVTRPSAKKAVDNVYKKLQPSYIVLFGSQDVFPFQQISNPVNMSIINDSDEVVDSDLPYACDAAYGTKMSAFIGVTRVVGRIPDVPGMADISYLETVFGTLTKYKSIKAEKLSSYFSVTADVWKKSTQESLSNIFGNCIKLKSSPTAVSGYPKNDMKPLIHFYNCHGSPNEPKFFGQKGETDFPVAQHSPDINGKVVPGTIVAAECCYGAELYNPDNGPDGHMSIANTYFKNKAIAFLGSSTIAYGPASGQGLADLITQYFVKNIMAGASTGRALLEARQKFIAVNGPHLDAYEQKTLAQFHLLGDPAVQVVIEKPEEDSADTVDNRRIKAFDKGMNLAKSIAPAEKIVQPKSGKRKGAGKLNARHRQVLKQTGFTGKEEESIYHVKEKNQKISDFAKAVSGGKNIIFRTFVKQSAKVNDCLDLFDVLVLKESGKEILGWRVYQRK